MALISCKDCGQDVSTLAASCLNCGRPVNPVTPPPAPNHMAAKPNPGKPGQSTPNPPPSKKGSSGFLHNIFDFTDKKSGIEALKLFGILWLISLLIGMLIGGLVGIVYASTPELVYAEATKYAQIFSIVFSLGCGFKVLKDKNLMGNIVFFAVALCSGVLAIFAGTLLGLIPTAYLSTKASKSGQ